MKFSIIFNSRNRTKLLCELFDNIIEKTANINDVEILINFDSDDRDSLLTISQLIQNNHPIVNVLNYEFKYRDQKLIRGYNRMASFAQGEYILVLNDDARIMTQDWDKISYPLLKKFPDDIVYGSTSDDSCDKTGGDGQYASFPIISRKAVEVLGFFMHDCFVGLGGDSGIYRVYNAINRIVPIPVDISHLLHQTVEKVINPDITAHEMRLETWAHPFDPWGIDISQDVSKLTKYIESQ